MRDEKEGRKKQARSTNNKAMQYNTPKAYMYMYMHMYMYSAIGTVDTIQDSAFHVNTLGVVIE